MLKLDRHKSIINKGFYNFQLLRSFAISFSDKRILTNNQFNFHNQHNKNNDNNNNHNKIPITNKQIKQIHTEYNALKKLIQRSFFHNNFGGFRQLHSSTLLCTNSNENKNASEGSAGGGGGSNNNQNNDKDDKNKRKRDENEEKLMSIFTKAIMWIFSIYVLIGILTMAIPNKNQSETSTRYVSWHEFVHHMLANGEVKEIILRPDLEMVTIVLFDGAIVKGRRLHDTIFHMAIADGTKFEEKLRDVEKRLGITTDGIPITYERNADLIPKILITLMVTALIFTIFTRMRGAKSPLSMDSFSQMGRAKFTLVDPIEGGKGVLFKDVAGLQEAKQEVREFVDYLKSPEKYQRLGAKVPKGALLLGPPGCGKTLLAKAVSTEAKVPFLSMNGSEFIEMIGGLGAARVRDLFKEAKNRAPCIIYIDEIDAIGRQRAGVGGSQQFSSGESEQTLNQLLVEMDGMATKQGVLMLASTNRADVLDKALLRPGRFDRHILIDLPNLIERREIFEKHLTGIALEHKPSVYSQRLAITTPGFSGADIANVCNEAALHAARHTQKIVNAKNLEYAVERLVGGTEKRSHALTHSERRVIAFHESGHALVGWLLPMSDILQKVTIVPRTSLALGFAQYTPSEQKLFTKEELFDKMCMALGGRAAENITFSRITTGAQNDLEKVTKIAYAQVKKFGMNERIGPMYIHDESDQEYPMSDKPYSKYFDNIIDLEVRKIITSAYEKTETLLKDNENKLRTLAEALLQKENLNYEEVVELIGPPLYESAKRKIDPVEFEQSLRNLSSSDNER